MHEVKHGLKWNGVIILKLTLNSERAKFALLVAKFLICAVGLNKKIVMCKSVKYFLEIYI